MQTFTKIKIPLQLSFTPWRKLSVWQNPLDDFKNDVLFLDLDLVITGNLDPFLTISRKNIVMKTGHKKDQNW